MTRVEATPTPSLLTWARESAGMSLEAAARKLGVRVEQLSSWEKADARPSIPQLRKIAEAYRRPLAAFYLPEPPKRFEVMHDFRRLARDADVPQRTPQLALEVRKAFDRREWALELWAELDEAVPLFSAVTTPNGSVEDAATRLRNALHITVEEQAGWRQDNEAFRGWRNKVERAGVLALQATNLGLDEARGFSISLSPLPVVVVNIKDAPRGRIFTLFHELTHIMLKEGGICDFHDADVEAYCNRVAGAALFPRESLLQSPTVRNHIKNDPNWSDAELRDLSRQFGGSREAALVRLLTLRLTTQSFYDRMRQEFLRQYEAIQKEKEESEGFAPPHVIALSSAGPLFTSLVLENLNREKITASDVSDYLQIRLKHLKELQREYSKADR
jgi:Zn-dependent peptidase ImmA (M78 family)/transcriptional regulator with XRE-family HTH domain